MRTDRIWRALIAAMAAIVITMSPAHLAAAAAQDPAPEEPSEPAEPAPEEPAEPAEVDGDEPAPEPGDVAPAVWVGVIALVVVAVAWALRQTTKPSPSSEGDLPTQ